MKIYRCNVCGNVVELVNDGGGTLVCCGEEMERIPSKDREEGNEKHLPVIEVEDNIVTVKVGSVMHPMTEAHYINWIALVYNGKMKKIELNPSDEPKATFTIDEDFNTIEAYEYCNVHGLWKNTFNK
jgi:superoxide reductase